jgi:4-hydroxybenzoate polyprenyltransferase
LNIDTHMDATTHPWFPKRIGAVLADIKIAHTVFALPFALASAHLAFMISGGYKLDILLAILVCMVMARTAAMSFNRYLDSNLDSENPRTNTRSIPSGRATRVDALVVAIACSLIFFAACLYLGPWPSWLSIPALAFILTYSSAKRFTPLTHIWLGCALAIAPTGAWLAVTGGWAWQPVILSVAVVFWVAGFDIIYSLQDIDFDRAHRVFSIPAKLGPGGALLVARVLHFLSFLGFAGFGIASVLIWPYWIALGLAGALLLAEHMMVRPNDFSRVGIAFFTVNGAVSILLFAGVLVSTLIESSPVMGFVSSH